eukprot:TRINITY_DN39716_c0_g1_i1.p1 TRINITY_DN39716_c0_g1~~TRINITY_DN39716_c0_g1_i1.p1  ORF type:complete len:241 (-),score=25.34 TRINITY_DN39716_c0_g1_i1:85-744(-)
MCIRDSSGGGSGGAPPELLPSANYFLQADKAGTISFGRAAGDLNCDEICAAIDNDYADRVEKSTQRVTQVSKKSDGVDENGEPKVSIHIHHHHYDNKGLLTATSLGGMARRKQYSRNEVWEVLDSRRNISIADSTEQDEFDMEHLLSDNEEDYDAMQRRRVQMQIQAANREAKALRYDNLAKLIQCICSKQHELEDLKSGKNAEKQFSARIGDAEMMLL